VISALLTLSLNPEVFSGLTTLPGPVVSLGGAISDLFTLSLDPEVLSFSTNFYKVI